MRIARVGGRHRLIEPCHARVGVTARHERQPHPGESQHLEVAVAGAPAELEGLAGVASLLARILGERGAGQHDPSARRIVRARPRDGLRSGQPTASHRQVPEGGGIFAREPRCRHGRRGIVAGATSCLVGGFPGVHGALGVAQPPSCVRQPVEGAALRRGYKDVVMAGVGKVGTKPAEAGFGNAV